MIVTPGRSGSTSLVESLRQHRDIAFPSRQLDCDDEELLRRDRIARVRASYSGLLRRPILRPEELVRAFYDLNRDIAFAGYKTMPNRHATAQSLNCDGSVQVITLRRRDVPSTVASFVMALQQGTWRRHGEAQENLLVLDADTREQIVGNVRYLNQCFRWMQEIQTAIHLEYEDLCEIEFRDAALERYFGRRVALRDPRHPKSAADYVEDWDGFRQLVKENWSDP